MRNLESVILSSVYSQKLKIIEIIYYLEANEKIIKSVLWKLFDCGELGFDIDWYIIRGSGESLYP